MDQWAPPNFPSYPEYPTQPTPYAPAPRPPSQRPYMPAQDELQRYVELGVLTEEEAENLRQRQMMEAKTMAPGPEGRMVGRVYVAAHPLEHFAHGLQSVVASQRLKQLMTDREKLLERRRAGLRAEQDIGQQTLGYPAPFGF